MKHTLMVLALAGVAMLGSGCSGSKKASEGAFLPLLNGRDLTGWYVKDGNAANWTYREGILGVEGENGGWLTSEKEYADFILRLEYKIPKDGNSGVGIRYPEAGDPAHEGMEIQILDDASTAYGDLKGSQLTGSIYYQVESEHDALRPPGEWNQYEIRAVGPRITVVLNGRTIVDTDVTEQTVGQGGYKALAQRPRRGHIGVQSHGSRVEFRNIEIQELNRPPASGDVSISAGEYARNNTPVVFALPEGARGAAALHLVGADGTTLPVQTTGDTAGIFILPKLEAGATTRFRIAEGVATAASKIEAEDRSGAVTFRVAGKPVFTYNSRIVEPPQSGTRAAFRRGGYIHPVLTPAGTAVTDDYPPNHLHHHGIWGAWTRTSFEDRAPDFWNMGDRTGRVEPVGLERTWDGPVHGGFLARHRYIDIAAGEKAVLNETWMVTVYNVSGTDGHPYRIFDLLQEQRTATDAPLVLPEYHYGGVGMRGHRQWNGEGKTVFLTSEGKDRLSGHATKARWCHMGGLVDGKPVGITMMDHPSNFRHPQPMRIHPSEPFFNYAPSQGGAWAIRPGETYRARYRFVVYDGEPDAALLDQIWNDFAHAVTATSNA